MTTLLIPFRSVIFTISPFSFDSELKLPKKSQTPDKKVGLKFWNEVYMGKSYCVAMNARERKSK